MNLHHNNRVYKHITYRGLFGSLQMFGDIAKDLQVSEHNLQTIRR